MAVGLKTITSVKAFVDAITSLQKERNADNAQQWFFRGQKNIAWDVRPNIFRGEELTAEHIFIDRAQRQNPIDFHDCVSNFEILTKLQHYGLGTRLLDVTLNPLVALYFATEPSSEYIKNQNGQFSLKGHDGIVYYRFVSGCSLRDIQIRIALSIPFVEFGKSMSLEKFCRHLADEDTISDFEYEQLITEDYRSIIELLQTNSFIVATNSNARLRQQRGAFLISPSINVKTTDEISTSILSKAKANLVDEFEGSYTIPEKSKESIREELDFFNVNEATLFPEFEHQMRYIQGQFYPSVGTVEDYRHYIRRTEKGDAVDFNKEAPDISKIIQAVISGISDDDFMDLKRDIETTIDTIDWYLKESVISRLRRTIKKDLSVFSSTIDAESTANEIVDEMLK